MVEPSGKFLRSRKLRATGAGLGTSVPSDARTRQSTMAEPPSTALASAFHLATTTEVEAAFAWYLEPRRSPFVVGVAGPFTTFNRDSFIDYCTRAAQLWVSADGSALILLTHIQYSMHVADLDFQFRAYPAAGAATQHLLQALRLLCGTIGVTKTQTFSLAGDMQRLALCEALGMRREGVLKEHFYHERTHQDLICSGWLREPCPG